jgi:hypothetical protein
VCAVAYHGTAADNVWSILQTGLRSNSGTREEKNGNMFGDGVYLSGDPRVAYSFCSSASSICRNTVLGQASVSAPDLVSAAAHSSPPPTITTVAPEIHSSLKSDSLFVFVAEIIALPENTAPHHRRHQSQRQADEAAYYVVADPSHVRLSRLLVYSSQRVSVVMQQPGCKPQAAPSPALRRRGGEGGGVRHGAAARPSDPVLRPTQLRGVTPLQQAMQLGMVVAAVLGMLLLLVLFAGG